MAGNLQSGKADSMTPRDFTYWLQGFMELTEAKSLDEKQTAMVNQHLALVFEKVIDDAGEDAEYCSTEENNQKILDVLLKPRCSSGMGKPFC